MNRKHEKYERLIARCKALTPVPTAVAHPCDESSLKGRGGSGRTGHSATDPRGATGQDPSRGGTVQTRHLWLRDRGRSPQPRRRRAGGATGRRGQGRDADEGQSAHRRVDGGGGAERDRALAPGGASAMLLSWTCRAWTGRSSLPTGRSTSSRRWKTRCTSSRTPLTWPMPWVSNNQRWRYCPRWKR